MTTEEQKYRVDPDLEPMCGSHFPCLAPVFVYTDLENDDVPCHFGAGLNYEIAKKAFEVVLLGLS